MEFCYKAWYQAGVTNNEAAHCGLQCVQYSQNMDWIGEFSKRSNLDRSNFRQIWESLLQFEARNADKQKDRFHDFLNELPEMTRQMKAMENAKLSVKDECSCNECHKKGIIDEMFYCGKCSFEICGACAYKKHHPHKAIPLLEKQKLLSKEEILKEASTFADLREKHESFTKIKSKFEASAENYLPLFRRFNKEVKELIKTPDDTPVFKKPKMENLPSSQDDHSCSECHHKGTSNEIFVLLVLSRSIMHIIFNYFWKNRVIKR
ncbi:unnamed protein product, partial [Mesorhabditis belari]|uniref:B box-type domain-containing protein n=1 Tax=Mesorhabditis belari TaxID=2138241 RepID=A0AAF3EKR0_9BILA